MPSIHWPERMPSAGALNWSSSSLLLTAVPTFAQNQQWIRQLGTTGVDAANAAAHDGSGGVPLGAGTLGSLGGQNAGARDAWLERYDSAGNPPAMHAQTWAKEARQRRRLPMECPDAYTRPFHERRWSSGSSSGSGETTPRAAGGRGNDRLHP